VSNGRLDIYSSTPRDKEDPDILGIILRICIKTASIERRTLSITISCLGCTTCIIIRKFLKSIKIYLLQLVHEFNLLTLTCAGGCVVCG
jgi:hypothetical protein